MFSAQAVLVQCGGVCDGHSLRVLCGDETVRRAVREGLIIRAARNRYVLPGTAEAVAAAARLTGTVSHLSAAQHWGWRVRTPPPRPQISVPPTRDIRPEQRADIEVRWQILPNHHRTAPGVTTRARTVADCARHLDFASALAVADSALRDRRVSARQVQAVLAQSPRIGQPQARRVLAAADARAANPFESVLRAIALDVAGLAVQPQYFIEWVGTVDLADPALRLVIEADSYAWHGGSGVFRYDIRRHAALVRAGWTVLRVCWEDAMFRPDYVALLLDDLVARGPDQRPVVVSAHDKRL